MSLAFYVALPPVLLALAVLWFAGGLWCERHFTWARSDSLIKQGASAVAFMLWMLGLVAGIGLFLGSLMGLFFKLFIA